MRRAGVARAVVDAAALAGAVAGLALIAGALARTPDRAVDAVGAVADAAPYTALLLGTALCVSFPLACWLGTATGMRSDSGAGRWLRALAIGLTAAPVAWTAMLLVLVLTRGPGLFPPGLAADPGPAPAGQTVVWVTYEHLALPLIALASALTGALALLIAGGVERALAGGPYKAALTAGMARRDALARVALPAALAPLLPLAGVATAVAISAAIVVEAVFQWPGLGRLALRAAGARDLETLQALFVGTAAVTILAGLAGDLAALRYAAEPTVRRVHRVARRPALAGAALLAAALGAGLAVALVSDAHRSRSVAFLQPPSSAHWLGTDERGGDVLAQVVEGAPASLGVALAAGLVAAGFVWLAGRISPRGFALAARLPAVPLALMLVVALRGRAMELPLGQTMLLTAVLGLVVGAALLARGSGFWGTRSLVGLWASGAALALAAETAIAVLGLDDPSRPSWGSMLADALAAGAAGQGAWWYVGPPGLAVMICTCALVALALSEPPPAGRQVPA